jgi:hypothetical protein
VNGKVYGIDCALSGRRLVRNLRDVLGRIRERRPDDFARIRRRLSIVKLLPKKAEDSVTLAEVKGCHYHHYSEVEEVPPCQLWLSRRLLDEDDVIQRAIVAHELGHVATTFEVFERRQSPDEEWGSELSADWFAWKWGFGRELRRLEKTRDWVHHAVGPGKTIENMFGKYLVTRNLVFRRIGDPDLGTAFDS